MRFGRENGKEREWDRGYFISCRRDTEKVKEVFICLYPIFFNYILWYDTNPVDLIFMK